VDVAAPLNAPSAPTRRRVPTWLFGLTAIPFGVVGAFSGQVMGRILSQKGIRTDEVSRIVSLTYLPSMLQFLWAPLVDVGLRRRSWLILLSVVGAGLLSLALALPLPSQLPLFTVLVVVASGVVGLTSSANGGLIATTLGVERVGHAGAWMNIGNLGAGAIGGYVAMELASRTGSLRLVGVALLVMTALPSLAVLAVPEPPRARSRGLAVFGEMLGDVVRTIKSRQGWTGIVICLSPVGTAAAINLFSSFAGDYHASDRMVNFVNGLWNGLLTALGCYLGGIICDRMNRRLAYVLAGALTAACAVAMALAPLSPTTYAVGVLAYMLLTGFCYAAYAAFVLEIVGSQQGAGASTRYTLFTAAANGAIGYMIWFDGVGYKRWGPRGLLAVDAASNVVGIVLLLALVLLLLRPRRAAAAAAAAAAAE
jgi:MFS family permease